MQNLGFQSRSLYDEQPGRKSSRPSKGRVRSTVSGALKKAWIWLKKPRSRKEWALLLLKTFGGLFGAGILLLGILWITLPNIDDPATMFPAQSTVILDRNGIELYRLFSEQDRTYVRGPGISPFIKEATIAIEDERFLSRSACFDVIGYMRAGLSQLAPGWFVRSGGSTLTQQFAGNALVGRQRSLLRKVRELLLACQLEQRYDKNELVELYLNWIPYGHNAYGIEQASKNYFGIGAKDLTLAQATVLASLPQRPSYFNPYGSHLKTTVSDAVKAKIEAGEITDTDEIVDAAVRIGLIGQTLGSGSNTLYVGGRTDQVLKNMFEQKLISEEQRTEALAELQKMVFASERQNIRAPHFVLQVQEEVQEILGIDEAILEQGGFRITTTLDWTLQQAAEKSVTSHREDVTKRFGAHNIALVSLSAKTREVMAYVGNADFGDDEHEGKIDMARSPRQPGSSFKAFTYLAAFEAGYGPGSIMYDVPTKFGEDQPQNFDGTFWGLMTMRNALGASRNIPAIKAFFLGGGEEPLLSLARRIGVPTPSEAKVELRKDTPDYDYGWPLAIGAAEAPLLEMVQGYATIADGGVFRPVKTILKVTDKDGNIRFAPKDEPPEQVVDERLTAMVTSVLSDVSARPNEYWQSILSVPGYEAAAKTGTSNKCLERDDKGACKLRRPESVWTLGFTPNLITGVWAGNATSQSLFDKADGLTTAAPIWHDYMVDAHKKMKGNKTVFAVPSRIARPLLSKLSGQLASACTPVELRASDLVLEENVPSQEDPACAMLFVDKVTGLLASDSCPVDASEEQSFFVPKSELPTRWPTWEQGVQEWAKKQMERWNSNETHSGSLLKLPVAPTESCDVSLTPGRLQKPSVVILSPSENGAVSMPSFVPKLDIDSVSAIKSVAVTIDGKPAANFTEAPFSGPVRVPRTLDTASRHIVTVTVTDEYFNTATASVSVRLENDTGAPSLSFFSPSEGEIIKKGESVSIRVVADDDAGIDRVQFFLDSTLLTTKRDTPYSFDYKLDVPAGSHILKAVAEDAAGNEGETSVSVTVE